MEIHQLKSILQKLNELKEEVISHKNGTKKGFDQMESIIKQIENEICSKGTGDSPKMIRKRARIVFPEVGMSHRTKSIIDENERLIKNYRM